MCNHAFYLCRVVHGVLLFLLVDSGKQFLLNTMNSFFLVPCINRQTTHYRYVYMGEGTVPGDIPGGPRQAKLVKSDKALSLFVVSSFSEERFCCTCHRCKPFARPHLESGTSLMAACSLYRSDSCFFLVSFAKLRLHSVRLANPTNRKAIWKKRKWRGRRWRRRRRRRRRRHLRKLHLEE